MKRILITALLLTAATLVRVDARGQEDAINAWADAFVAAWNKNDAPALAALWADDGDLINPFGRRANGRPQIEQLLHSEHTSFAKGTTYAITSPRSMRFLKSDVVVVDWDCEVTGMKGADGKEKPVFKHHVTWVLVKRSGEWLAVASRPAAPVAMAGQ